MKRKHLITGALFICITGMLSFDLPSGWQKAGREPDKYDMGIDPGAGINGKNVATIKSISKKIKSFGTLMQSCSTDKYLGKRVRMSGTMKSANVANWAGFWFRVDQQGSDERLAFDNMNNRPVKGTTDWKRYEIVLDIPANATNMAYGALLGGTGQIWFDDIRFDVVDSTVPTTNLIIHLKEPQNLNFED